MTVQQRREREREQRRQLIIDTARRLAEADGWEAVTVRRLADRIEYSQPVLYSHFDGKQAIVSAVAVQGCAELAEKLRAARESASGVPQSVAAVARAYQHFAEANPALYDAIFTLTTDLPFARPEAPQPLHDAFNALADTFAPLAGARDVGVFTELVWSALHGLVTLTRAGRLPAQAKELRLMMLVEQLMAAP